MELWEMELWEMELWEMELWEMELWEMELCNYGAMELWSYGAMGLYKVYMRDEMSLGYFKDFWGMDSYSLTQMCRTVLYIAHLIIPRQSLPKTWPRVELVTGSRAI